ncbi:MAG: xanthine dehydrogenase family protein subunit M [Caldilineaceae bacterium]|nr:xanthine dehydrogenase family protein subunit M [Caldilineaceae bacterium]HRJ43778.1 xanthine dehydrogenase family protein subunit M [Caldilineaceae bacterium]
MQAFDFVSARSVDEVVAVLAAGGERARPLSGGTDLLTQMKEGRRSYATVVDLKRIPELMEIRFSAEGGLWLGASVPCHAINKNADVQKRYPALRDSTGLIGGTQVQGRASLGGNLCNASPAADGIPNLIIHSVTAHIVGPNGTRQVAVEDFCTAPGRTVLQNGEILVALEFPAPVKNFGAAYLRFIPRNEMDIAVVGVGASVVLSDDGQTIQSARISLGAVAPTPLFVKAAGDALAGQPVSEESFEKAAQIAWEAAKPINDMRGTIAQRKHLSGVLTKRALRIAIDRARGISTVDSLGRLNGHG